MVIAGLLTGLIVGVVNGLLVTCGRVVPFIATLAMLTIARGLALTITEAARPVRIEDAAYIAARRGAAVRHHPVRGHRRRRRHVPSAGSG